MKKPRTDQRNSVRIIGGQWRSRRLAIPRATAVRPTPDRVRETLFNWLTEVVPGATCLDLYAGTGALGLEAISRGAREVWLVERDGALARNLRSNVRDLNTTSARVLQSDATALLSNPPSQSFDLAFLDPPYEEPLEPLFAHLYPWLAKAAQVYVERGVSTDSPDPLAQLAAALPGSKIVKQGRAAGVAFGLLQFEPS